MKKCVEESAASGPEGPMRFFDSEYRMNLQARAEGRDSRAASQGQREGGLVRACWPSAFLQASLQTSLPPCLTHQCIPSLLPT